MPQRRHYTCTVEGCGRPHKAAGLCQTHYMQTRRGAPITPVIRVRAGEKPPECSEADCHNPVKAKGLCMMHYARLLRHGYTTERARTRPPKPCSVPGCGNRLYSNGLCNQHHLRFRKAAQHGMSFDDYLEMQAKQRFVCAICEQPERAVNAHSLKRKELAIDHCHDTGKVRGLLCSSCNRGLGLFADDPQLLQRAADYLKSHR